MSERMSIEEFNKLSKRKKGRMKSKKVCIGGHEFDSITEGNIYLEFKYDPDVEIVAIHPEFDLIEPFISATGKKIRGTKWTADFHIKRDGLEWIVDVKSPGTIKANSKSWPLKRKMFLNKYRQYRFLEIIIDKKTRIEKKY